MTNWIPIVVSVIALVISIALPFRLFRISTYPVPQITLATVTDQPTRDMSVFRVDIRHVGEKTTIVRPELYVFAGDPGRAGSQRSVSYRHREEWICFYKRVLADVPPGGTATERFPAEPSVSPPVNALIDLLLRRFPHAFIFQQRMSDDQEPLNRLSYQILIGTPPQGMGVPMLIFLQYDLGLSNQPRQRVEREYRVRINSSMPFGPGSDALIYQVVSARTRRFAGIHKRFFRKLVGAEGISE